MTPATNDPKLRDTMSEVFMKFHVYGQGKSMLTLARQQDILGYELDPHYSMVVHFVQGDLDWLIYTDEIPLKDRLFYLNLFYFFIGDPKVKMEYAERLIARKLLNPSEQLELEILTMLDLYTLAGQPKKALERLKRSYQVISEPDYENFVPVTVITELFIQLVAGAGDDELERLDEAASRILRDKPFLREIGGYKVVKGLWKLRRAQWTEGEKLINEGLQVLDMSGFVPLRLYAMYRIYHFCRMFPVNRSLQHKYESLFTAELEAYGLVRLEQALENLLLPLLESP